MINVPSLIDVGQLVLEKTSVNIAFLLWPHPTPGDHELNKLESSLCKELSCKSEHFLPSGSSEDFYMTPSYFAVL
jgi:hypothetical protein